MIRSILTPFDGSSSAEAALNIGCSVAGITGGYLKAIYIEDQRRLMHYDLSASVASAVGIQPVFPVPLPPDKMLEIESKFDLEYQKLLAFFEEQLREAHIRGDFIRRRGMPVEVILEASREVDFVVMGNHGKHTGVEYIENGFTTNALLQETTRPVLVVPADPQGESSLVIAYDGSPAAERTLRVAAEFAELTEMERIHLFTVETHKERAEEILAPAREYLSIYDVEVLAESRGGKTAEEILRYTSEVGASVLALGAFGKTSFASKLFGSTTSAILKDTDRAVLLSS